VTSLRGFCRAREGFRLICPRNCSIWKRDYADDCAGLKEKGGSQRAGLLPLSFMCLTLRYYCFYWVWLSIF